MKNCYVIFCLGLLFFSFLHLLYTLLPMISARRNHSFDFPFPVSRFPPGGKSLASYSDGMLFPSFSAQRNLWNMTIYQISLLCLSLSAVIPHRLTESIFFRPAEKTNVILHLFFTANCSIITLELFYFLFIWDSFRLMSESVLHLFIL